MQDQACAGSMQGKEVFSGGGYKAVLFSACSLVLSGLHRIHSFSCQTLSYYFVALLFFVSQFSCYNISTRTNKSFVFFGHPGLHPLCPIPLVSCLKLIRKRNTKRTKESLIETELAKNQRDRKGDDRMKSKKSSTVLHVKQYGYIKSVIVGS